MSAPPSRLPTLSVIEQKIASRRSRASWDEQPLSKHATSTSAAPLQTLATTIQQCMVQWSAEYLDEATKGDVMAMVMVGEMYLVGWGTFPQNRDEAIRWLTKAAKYGNVDAHALLKHALQTAPSHAQTRSSKPNGSASARPTEPAGVPASVSGSAGMIS